MLVDGRYPRQRRDKSWLLAWTALRQSWKLTWINLGHDDLNFLTVFTELCPVRHLVLNLKGQCHEIFKTYFIKKNSTWVPHEQAKTVSRIFTELCPVRHLVLNLKVQCHEIFKTYFIKKKIHLGPTWTGKNGFMKILFFAKIFAKNLCPRSHWQCWLIVLKYHNYKYFFLFYP